MARTQLLNSQNDLVGYYDPNNGDRQILDKYGSEVGGFTQGGDRYILRNGSILGTYSGNPVLEAATVLLCEAVHLGLTV